MRLQLFSPFTTKYDGEPGAVRDFSMGQIYNFRSFFQRETIYSHLGSNECLPRKIYISYLGISFLVKTGFLVQESNSN